MSEISGQPEVQALRLLSNRSLWSLSFSYEQKKTATLYPAPSALASARGKKPTTLFLTASALASRARAKN